jgi:hypothetical protein
LAYSLTALYDAVLIPVIAATATATRARRIARPSFWEKEGFLLPHSTHHISNGRFRVCSRLLFQKTQLLPS